MVSDEVLHNSTGLLFAGSKPTHVHYTHGRSGGVGHTQPDTMTRQQFWKHLEACYAEAYPDPSSPTGSILAFALVAEEPYPTLVSGYSATHKHAACFTSTQHRWNRVAEISRRKGLFINAVAHHSYAVMYRYLRQPSAKKQLSMLDAEPLLSRSHPRGTTLQALLEASDRSAQLNGMKAGKHKRERAPDMFALISEHRFRTATELRVLACSEAGQGRTALAEWCTRKGGSLQELIDNAWCIIDAPVEAKRERATRLQVLQVAADTAPCVCDGSWQAAASLILSTNGICPDDFAKAIHRALDLGAVRGAHVACIGRGGCGKSTLLESLEDIFRCAEKPQIGSTFPLTNVIGSDVLLWQDYAHEEKTIAFTDLLGLLTGESIGIRVPGRPNTKFRNPAPLFYSGRCEIRSGLRDMDAARMYDERMQERFGIFRFTTPVPFSKRKVIKQCAKCFARFVLCGRPSFEPSSGGAASSSLTFV
jgi:hypothetical protein